MLVQFIERGITPVVPLRGSISASGDLSPLSYIAASLTGHPDVKCRVRSANGSKLQVMSAPDALHLHGLSPVTLGPKEGLGLINGTAVSAAMGAFALDEALVAHLLSQALTGMTVEAMLGTSGSFHPCVFCHRSSLLVELTCALQVHPRCHSPSPWPGQRCPIPSRHALGQQARHAPRGGAQRA